jgi:hypothetical protein
VNKLGHWLRHKLGMYKCDLVEIRHDASCPGFCFIDPSVLKQCDWKVVLKARCCGKVEVIGL